MSKIRQIIEAGLRKAHLIAQEHDKPPHEAALIKEIHCDHGTTLLIRGYDSTLGNGDENFIRRYPILLKMPTLEKAQELINHSQRKPESLQPDGTILLDSIPGDVIVVGQHVETLEKSLKKEGIHIPRDISIFDILMEDSEKCLAEKRHIKLPEKPDFLSRQR